MDDNTTTKSNNSSLKSNRNNKKQSIYTDTDYLLDELQNTEKIKLDKVKYDDIRGRSIKEADNESISEYLTTTRDEKPNFFNSMTDNKTHHTENNNTHQPSKNDEGFDFDKLSKEDQEIKKLEMLEKLGKLVTERKVKLSRPYNINSSYKLMEYEYKLLTKVRNRTRFVNWSVGLLFSMVEGAEILLGDDNEITSKISLRGWKDRTNKDIDDYIEVIGEFYDVYMSSTNEMDPLLKLACLVGYGAITTIIANAVPEKNLMTQDELEEYRNKHFEDEKKRKEKINLNEQDRFKSTIDMMNRKDTYEQFKTNEKIHNQNLEKLKKEFDNGYNNTVNQERQQFLNNMRAKLTSEMKEEQESSQENNSASSSSSSKETSKKSASKSIYTGKKGKGISIKTKKN